MLTQVPSGWLAQRFGGKRVFGLMMLASSLSTVLVPVAARTHLFVLLSLRFIAGIGSVCRHHRCSVFTNQGTRRDLKRVADFCDQEMGICVRFRNA